MFKQEPESNEDKDKDQEQVHAGKFFTQRTNIPIDDEEKKEAFDRLLEKGTQYLTYDDIIIAYPAAELPHLKARKLQQVPKIYRLIQNDLTKKRENEKSTSAINKKISKKLNKTVNENVKNKIAAENKYTYTNYWDDLQKLISQNVHITNEEHFLNTFKSYLRNEFFRNTLKASTEDFIYNPHHNAQLLLLNNKIKKLITQASYKYPLPNKLKAMKKNKKELITELKEELRISLKKMDDFLKENEENAYAPLLQQYEDVIRDFYKKVQAEKANLSNSKHLILIELTYRLLFLAEHEDDKTNQTNGANRLGIVDLATKLQPTSSCLKRHSDTDLNIQSIIDDIIKLQQHSPRPSM